MIQFYAPDIATTHTLPESDSQHCVKVLRKSPGDIIEVIDGKGRRFTCRLKEAHPKRATVEILDSISIPPFWPNRTSRPHGMANGKVDRNRGKLHNPTSMPQLRTERNQKHPIRENRSVCHETEPQGHLSRNLRDDTIKTIH